VFRQTMLRFVFRIRGLHLEDDWLTFYIKRRAPVFSSHIPSPSPRAQF
jgi:hypothetical protein